jgi:putative DNA primase/helicase
VCGNVDVEAIKRDRDQLWAEAVAAYQGGREWWLTAEQEHLAEGEQEERREVDVWEPIIMSWADNPIPVPASPEDWHGSNRIGISSQDVLTHCLDKPVKDQTRYDAMRVASVFQAQGWVRKQLLRDVEHGRWGVNRGVVVRQRGWYYQPPQPYLAAAEEAQAKADAEEALRQAEPLSVEDV